MDLLFEAVNCIEYKGLIGPKSTIKKKAKPIRGCDRKLKQDPLIPSQGRKPKFELTGVYKDFLEGTSFEEIIKRIIYSHNPARTDVEQIYSNLIKIENTTSVIFEIYIYHICHHTVIYVDKRGDILISDRDKASLDWCIITNSLKNIRSLPKDPSDTLTKFMKRIGYGISNVFSVNGRFYSPYSKNYIKAVIFDVEEDKKYDKKFFREYSVLKNKCRSKIDVTEPLPTEFL